MPMRKSDVNPILHKGTVCRLTSMILLRPHTFTVLWVRRELPQ